MKNIKYFIVIILMLFSFYLSDQVTNLAINKNPIMQTIQERSETLTVMGSNATIKENTIIPGISGKKVNEKESFFKMKEFGAFNETFLIYDTIKPDISLSDNKDKVIISGNKTIRQVSIIIEDDENLKNYLNQNNIIYDVLSTLNTSLDNQEYLNSEIEEEKFNDLESVLKKNDSNKNICILNHSNIELCKEKEKYIVKPSLILSDSLILKQKQEISNGTIILINKNVSKESINIILNQIKFLDLNIVHLSKLIAE